MELDKRPDESGGTTSHIPLNAQAVQQTSAARPYDEAIEQQSSRDASEEDNNTETELLDDTDSMVSAGPRKAGTVQPGRKSGARSSGADHDHVGNRTRTKSASLGSSRLAHGSTALGGHHDTATDEDEMSAANASGFDGDIESSTAGTSANIATRTRNPHHSPPHAHPSNTVDSAPGSSASASSSKSDRKMAEELLAKAVYKPEAPRAYKINLPPTDRPVRIYADGVYDLFHYGHMLQLKQAKLSFPNVYLMAGVCSDSTVHMHKAPTVYSEAEREECVRNCRWVDEVIHDGPWVVDEAWITKHEIDYVSHDEEPYVSAGHDDVYAYSKSLGKFLPTRRTDGVSTSDLLTRVIKMYKNHDFDAKLKL